MSCKNPHEFGFPHHDLVHSVVDRINTELLTELEHQIIERLKQHGYKFENQQELHEFASSDRCRIFKKQIRNGSFDCWLFVDGKEVAFWNDEVKILWEENKITATMND